MSRRSFDSVHYLASDSLVPLSEVLLVLEEAFDLPPFELDGKASWEYAYSERRDLGLNVTRARRSDVIETWIEGTPPGSTYQIIVYARSKGPSPQDVRDLLSDRCGMTTHYIKSGVAPQP